MKELLDIFIVFFKVGGLTFGGGYAMLPILEKEVVKKKEWYSYEEIMDFYAIGQCTPGIIAVNNATYIGYGRKGVLGGISAALGVVTPSLIIIMIIAAFLDNIMSFSIVQDAFNGIKVGVAALIVNAVINMVKVGVKDCVTLIIFIISSILLIVFDVSPILIIILSAIVGILLCGGKKK